ncbi:Uncharacterised protein [Yersinia enterocolitica]|uniref:Uncharacterized protein n=1 Tax=Yersinia enterocolitica TaxID=630 RepID=A0ABP1Y594_YEREN|nr:Uncharacterised protein [Yersinia enterocolitica]CRX85060.1 Uncharacterised protein [Yersinia enterocolitica]
MSDFLSLENILFASQAMLLLLKIYYSKNMRSRKRDEHS